MEENKKENQPYPYKKDERKPRKRPAAVLILLVLLLLAAVGYIFYSRGQYNDILEHNRQTAIAELTALQADYDTLYVQDAKLKI